LAGDSKNIIEFTLLFNRYKRNVYNYALKMTVDNDISEDIVQNVFLKLFENLPNIRNKDSIVYWIFKTARNEIFTHFRKKKVIREKFEPLNDEYTSGTNYSMSEAFELKEIKKIVLSMLEELPDEQKEVYLLREYGGLSYNEIARVTEVEEKTVKSRLYKVRQKIIKKLSKVI
jgi:RNA polymerase sigma-70 factor (ECF subfamily)